MINRWMEFVRFSHTVFALPFALASMFVAAEGLPSWNVVIWILVAMMTARNAAMGFNRYIDRDIDAKNPRTERRHLVSGEISTKSALVFIIVNIVIFVFSAWMLNPLAFSLSVPTVLVLMSYSLWKRFSWLCHFFLGIAIGLSPAGAWVAVRGDLDWYPVVLGLVLAFWIAGFDMIYATQDQEVDQDLELHSIPSRFGTQGALRFAAASHILMLISLIVLSYMRSWSLYSFLELGLIGGILLYIHKLRKSNSLDDMNKDFFLANAGISVIMMVSLIGETFLN